MNKEFFARNESLIVSAACAIAHQSIAGASMIGSVPTPEEQQAAAINGVDTLFAVMEKLSQRYEQIQSSDQ